MSLPFPTTPELEDAISKIQDICNKSEGRSQFFPYGGSGYKASVTHFFESSTQVAACAVQPGSVADLQAIIRVIADTRTHFAVKSGGHSTNPGFSSTTGVQIDLSRMNHIDVDAENLRVRVGAGCLFDELYQAVDGYGLNIVGGEGLAGIGVSGWMLGGGYSVKTSRLGLGIDNLAGATIVLPSGELREVSDENYPDLFFAIKGGCNNFGIVVEFTLIAHKQGEYHDFTLIYEEEYFNQVNAAIVKIIDREDNRANIEATYRHEAVPGMDKPQVTMMVHCVYDGTYPPEKPFAELDNIPHSGGEVNSTDRKSNSVWLANLRRSYLKGTYDLFSAVPEDPSLGSPVNLPKPPMAGIGQFPRGRWGNVMIDEFTPSVIEFLKDFSYEAARDMDKYNGVRVAIDFWPFTKTMFDDAKPSAWPHKRGQTNCPIIVYMLWEDKQHDDHWIRYMSYVLGHIRDKVFHDRPLSQELPYFINTAFAEGTTVFDLYRDNLKELEGLRVKYDPNNVMGLTGGFRIPLPNVDPSN